MNCTNFVCEVINATSSRVRNANCSLVECFHEQRLSGLLQVNHRVVCLVIQLLFLTVHVDGKVECEWLFGFFGFPYVWRHSIRWNRNHIQFPRKATSHSITDNLVETCFFMSSQQRYMHLLHNLSALTQWSSPCDAVIFVALWNWFGLVVDLISRFLSASYC